MHFHPVISDTRAIVRRWARIVSRVSGVDPGGIGQEEARGRGQRKEAEGGGAAADHMPGAVPG